MCSASSRAAVATPRHHAPSYHLSCAGASDTGKARSHNEDRFGVYPEVGLFVVADGMGGAAAGEVAAQMAVDHVHAALVDRGMVQRVGTASLGHEGLSRLVASVEGANRRIHEAALWAPEQHGMGTTLAALLVGGNRAVLAHVGDSRIYRLRDRRIEALTEDHSLFNELVQRGLADPEHPERFTHRSVVTRAVGVDPTVEVDARVVEVARGDIFILCTDGLSGVVNECELRRILLEHVHLDEAAERLIERANELGGPDNITAVLVRIE